MSETIRVAAKTKEALLKVAARLQEQSGTRVDFDEAINHLLMVEDKSDKNHDSFLKFVGSAKGAKNSDLLLKELAKERRLDELRARRKYGV